ncbi:unnamed protein product [Rotaria socialis]|uniref:Uncharacterized protein n=1 Tax=Rotaria socialis TaxID=392032 RepID=A0A820V0P1_9BILA|nr:unnamed protein product [Rotaria socialis]
MNRISFNDNRKNRIVDLFIGPDNVLRKDYFHGVFPEATGIIFYDNEVNRYVGIPRDENGSFKFEWSPNVMYELVYRDGKKQKEQRDLIMINMVCSNLQIPLPMSEKTVRKRPETAIKR